MEIIRSQILTSLNTYELLVNKFSSTILTVTILTVNILTDEQ